MRALLWVLFFLGEVVRADTLGSYLPARAASLGNAFLPLGDDVASGLFINPAVLAQIREPVVELFNVAAQGNASFYSTLNSNSSRALNLPGFAPTLNQNPTEAPGLGAVLAPSVGYRGWGLSVLVQSQLTVAGIDSGADLGSPPPTPAVPSLRYRSLYQIIPALGYGRSLYGGRLKIGYSLLWINQASGSAYALPGDVNSGWNQNLGRGSTLSSNLGFLLKFPSRVTPSLGLVVRNFLTPRFWGTAVMPFASPTDQRPAPLPMVVDASLGMQLPLGAGSLLRWVVQAQDLLNRSGEQLLERLAVGTELELSSHYFLRGGYNGRYPALGLGYKRLGAELSIAWYRPYEAPSPFYLLQYQVRTF